MKNSHQKHGLGIPVVVLIISTAMLIQGCVVFLTSVATVVNMRGNKHHTATVLVKKSPATVYAAMNKILDIKTDVEVLKRDEQKNLIEASHGENRATVKAVDYDSGLTQIIVTADAGEEGRSDEDLAFDVVKLIVDELGVDYRVIED